MGRNRTLKDGQYVARCKERTFWHLALSGSCRCRQLVAPLAPAGRGGRAGLRGCWPARE